ncbi:MAG TPA: hypothetical protein VFW23_06075 [Tepidisphaeraceae bacterium]|nr:hypothetical protein [Tepidisphaeraceae bacterium]
MTFQPIGIPAARIVSNLRDKQMITELYRADNNTRFALRSGHISDRWGWIIECLQEEFPHWWCDDVDTIELDDGDELITINNEPKAVVRYRVGWDALR